MFDVALNNSLVLTRSAHPSHLGLNGFHNWGQHGQDRPRSACPLLLFIDFTEGRRGRPEAFSTDNRHRKETGRRPRGEESGQTWEPRMLFCALSFQLGSQWWWCDGLDPSFHRRRSRGPARNMWHNNSECFRVLFGILVSQRWSVLWVA